MSEILTVDGIIMCPHGGTAPLSGLCGNALCQIGTRQVLTEQSVGAVSFACAATPPCTSVVSWIPQQVTFSIRGIRVLMSQSIPVTNNGAGKVINAGQVKCFVRK